MKKRLLMLMFFASIVSFGQQKQLLRNKASNKEMKIAEKSSVYNYQTSRNYTIGNSEVYLGIAQRGYFVVELGNQLVGSPNGKFRFFELSFGEIPISIYHDGHLIYRSLIHIPSNSRVVLDFNRYLYLVEIERFGQEIPLLIDNDYLTEQEFNNFMKAVNKEAFDEEKNQVINSFLTPEIVLTTSQIRKILKTFQFDKTRLQWAKKLYKQCDDQRNYYTLTEVFVFASDKEAFRKFLGNQ